MSECETCGASCCFKHHKDGPCWGVVMAIDEVNYGTEENPEWEWIHACHGHRAIHDCGSYIKQHPSIEAAIDHNKGKI